MNAIEFTKAEIIVVGDVMLDMYYYGTVSRISPEAPVPVVKVDRQSRVPGGAGNVAHNLATLKVKHRVISLTGEDENATILSQLFDAIGIEHDLHRGERPTITKSRVIGNHQQVVRLDFEQTDPINITEESALCDLTEKELLNANVLVISDYAKGVCTHGLCQRLISAAGDNCTVIVDPKGSDWEKYRGASMVTPNVRELGDQLGYPLENKDAVIENAARPLLEKFDLQYVLVTRSEKGMSLIGRNEAFHMPTEAREVYDVSGAGDTVVAVVAAALGAGYSLRNAVELANRAAGVVVSKFGTAPILLEELQRSAGLSASGKIVPRSQLVHRLEQLKSEGRRTVFTNGCFDILHRGHVSYLQKARELGDVLILGLNTDDSVRRLKGPSRPLNNENDRAMVLAALECVDLIVLFGEDTPYELLKEIKPDVLVKGGDYTLENVIGREFAGQTVLIDFVEGYSTTRTLERMQADENE